MSESVDQESKVFEGLQQEFIKLCAEAGEKQWIIANTRKALQKINLKLKKVDLKAKKMVEANRSRMKLKAENDAV